MRDVHVIAEAELPEVKKMDEEKIALHVGRIRRALEEEGKQADEHEIRKDFLEYLVKYGLGENRSEQKVLEKYGVDISKMRKGEELKLNRLTPGEMVTVRGRVLSINRAVSTRDGEEVIRYYGIIRDDTGTAPFNAWGGTQLDGIEKGDDIEISGAFVTEWNGNPQIKVVSNTVVKKVELDFDIPVSGGARGPSEEVKLSDVSPGKRISFTARILSIEERTITARGEQKTIYSGMLSDGTAKVAFTAWKDFGVESGDVIKVDGAYVREWRGTPQINLDEGMELEKIEIDFPSMDELDKGTPLRIWEAEERTGVNDALLDAVVVQVKNGSGLIFRCPECRWVLQNGMCKKHGKVEGVPDLRIKAVLDDGTGAINMVAGAEITSKLLGKSISECVKEAKEKMDHAVIFREIEEILLTRPVIVRGNIVSDDMSMTMIANEMSIKEGDPVEEAAELIEEWGV